MTAKSTNRAAQLLNEIASSLTPAGEILYTEPVLMIWSFDPIMVAGRESYHHDLLSRLGGTNAFSMEGWVELSLEDLIRLNPPAIIVLMENETSDDIYDWLPQRFSQLDIDAIQNGRVAALVHKDVMLPSSSVGDVAKEMRRALIQPSLLSKS